MRQPSLAAGIALGALLLVVVSTAYPLFLSASDSELLATTMARPAFTQYGAGLGYRQLFVPLDAKAPDGGSLLQEQHDAFAQADGTNAGFGPVAETLAGATLEVTAPGTPGGVFDPGRLFAGTDALSHVEIISGTDGDGVWLPNNIAGKLHLGPGDHVQLNNGDRSVSVPVDGVYVALVNESPDGYWQIWHDQLLLNCIDCSPPPQFIIADAPQMISLQRQLGLPSTDEAFVATARTDPPMTLSDARSLRTTVGGLVNQMYDPSTELGTLFPCCPRRSGHMGIATEIVSQTSHLVDIVEARSTALRGPASVLLVAGLAISFLVVCAAGAFSFTSKSSEAALLNARGWGPVRVALKAGLEAVVPVVAGAVVGLAITDLLVRTVGPQGPVERTVLIAAVVVAVLAALAALAVIGGVAGVMFAAHHESAGRARFILWVPWELLALGVVLIFGRTLRSGGGLVGTGDVQRPGAALFLYPIACAAALGIFVARVAAMAVAHLSRKRGGSGASARWLALRRVSSSVRPAAVFLITAATAVAVAVSARGLVSSLRTTVVAKAKIFVGSDVQAQVVGGALPPADFPYPITAAERVPDAGYFDQDSTDAFQLLVIDPSTFAGAAFWENSWSDVPRDELLGRLDAAPPGTLPIVIANGTAAPTTITVGTTQVPVTVVGRTDSFPGYNSAYPLVVVSRDAALRTFPEGFNLFTIPGSSTEFWIHGPTDGVLDAIRHSSIEATSVITADEVRDIPFIVSVVNTFLTLDILGVMALLLVLSLAVVYMQVRQRARVTATGLSGRMGASPSLLRRATVLELGGILLGSLAIGVPAGLFASSMVLRSLDPLPLIPPRISFATPWTSMVAMVVLMLIAVVIGTWFVDRAARKADLSQVMRVAV